LLTLLLKSSGAFDTDTPQKSSGATDTDTQKKKVAALPIPLLLAILFQTKFWSNILFQRRN